MKLAATSLRIAATLALGVLASHVLDCLFAPEIAHAAPAEARINPYAKNPFIASGRPFLFWHKPGARYIQDAGGHAIPYRINRRGFRGPEPAPAPPAGTHRLLLVGDSTVEGAGSEWSDTFASRTGDALRAAGWDVVNAAMQGASPIYAASNLERYFALKPNAILLVLSENDLIEDRERERAYALVGPMARPDVLVNGLGVPAPAFANSLRALTGQGQFLLRLWLRPTAAERTMRANATAWKRTHPGSTDVRDQPLPQQLRDLDASWALTTHYLDLVADACRARNVSLLVATLNLVPIVFDTPEVRENAARLDAAAAGWASHQERPFLAIAPALRQAAGSQDPRQLVTADAHLTPDGHRLTTAALTPWLQAQLAVPGLL